MARPTTKMKTILRRGIQGKKFELKQLSKLQGELLKSYQGTEKTIERIQDQLRSKGIYSESQDPKDVAHLVTQAIDAALDELGVFLQYYESLNEFDKAGEVTITDDAKAQDQASIRKAIKAVQRLVSNLQKILVTLGVEKLPAPVPHLVNFKRNNKLPAPDDEDIKRRRLPVSIAQELAITLDLTDKEMANILTISIRTYHRLKLNGLLNPVASERLLLLKDLATFGLEVFEVQNNFNKWLRLPIPDLSSISPLDSLDTATGFNHVKTVLERIEYGVYS